MTADNESDKGEATHKFLNEKDNAIQLLKKKLKIPSTHLIQSTDITELEKKETLNDELNDCKAKILKFSQDKKLWEKDIFLLIENEKTLKRKQEELEKELNENEKDPDIQIFPPLAKANADSNIQEMFQVSLTNLEFVGLKLEIGIKKVKL